MGLVSSTAQTLLARRMAVTLPIPVSQPVMSTDLGRLDIASSQEDFLVLMPEGDAATLDMLNNPHAGFG